MELHNYIVTFELFEKKQANIIYSYFRGDASCELVSPDSRNEVAKGGRIATRTKVGIEGYLGEANGKQMGDLLAEGSREWRWQAGPGK